MYDDTGARRALDGSSPRIMPAATGGLATSPKAPDQDLYAWSFTAREQQRLAQAADEPLLDAEVQLLQVLVQRLVASDKAGGHPARNRRRGASVRRRERKRLAAQITLVGRAIDVLRRAIATRQSLAPEPPSELMQLLDAAAAHIEYPLAPHDPAAHSTTKKHDP